MIHAGVAVRAILDAALSEAEWQQQIIDLARLCGWDWYHVYDSRRSNPGWPDLALWCGPHLWLVEAKSERGRLSAAQQMTLDGLRQVQQVHVALWRPRDWPTVERVLAGPAR
jgi:hypothetical protein